MDITITPQVDTGKGATPQMPMEPPKEVKEMVFSTENLEKILGKEPGQSIITSKGQEIKEVVPDIKKEEEKPVEKKEEPKKEGVKKVEASPVIKPPKEEKKIEEVVKEPVKEIIKEEKKETKKLDTLISPVKPSVEDTFDYSKYNQEEQHVLKNMNRTSREYVSKLMEKSRIIPELEKGLYLQHENAYVISPEFQGLRQKEFMLRKEHAAYEDALVNIRAGKPFKIPVKYDDNGNLVMSEERMAGDKDQITIESQLASYVGQIGQTNQQIRELPTRYKQAVDSGLKAVEEERRQHFAWAQDPKLLDYTVETEKGEIPIKKVISDFVSIWPPYLQNDPGVRVAADLFVALQIRSAELQRALNGKAKEDVKADEDKLTEPTSDVKAVESKVTKVNGKEIPEVFSLEGSPLRR